MSKTAKVTGVILGILLIIGIWLMGNYNSLIVSKSQVDKSWAMVETQYQRRLDLIDNLVASVKGAQKQEVDVFVKIAEARKVYNNPSSTTEEKVNASSQIETNVVALLPRLQEAYPDLKSNQQVQGLMNELSGTENGILKERNKFNETVTNYNINIQRFPKSVFANMFGFEKHNLFKSNAGASVAPTVKF